MNNSISTTKNSADILKFIMSVFVVATHTGLFAPYLTPLVRLAVPVFFVLSGYFFFSRVNSIESPDGKKAYLKKSVKHNLQLYGFWFVLLLPLTVYVRGYFSASFLGGIKEMIHDFFFASTFQASWYITALVIDFILVFFLGKKCSNKVLIVIGIILYIPSLISSNYLFISNLNEEINYFYNIFIEAFALPCNNFFAGFIYIVLGKALAEEKKARSAKTDAIMSILFFVILVVEFLALKNNKVEIKNTDCFIMLPFVSFFLCRFVLLVNVKCSFSTLMRKISTLSYCSHMAVFMCVGKILTLLDISDKLNIIVFALTLLLTWALGLVILKLEKHKVFGFLKYSH